jgi:hypothetical protein
MTLGAARLAHGAPARQVRALFDTDTIVVYQAYAPAIAEAAIAAGRFVAPFKFDRMTWIKPSFLWMMYRCGWATKPGQERVLAITLTRDGFDWALAHSCLTHYDPGVFGSHADWLERMAAATVRIQWDPERSLRMERLDHGAIQIGLTEPATERYVHDWTVAITDTTELARTVHDHVAAGDITSAAAQLPAERPYPLRADLKALVGAS